MTRLTIRTAVRRLRTSARRTRKEVGSARLRSLVRALDADTADDALTAAVGALTDADAPTVWLALAVLTARLPSTADVIRLHRLSRLEGPRALLDAILAEALDPDLGRGVEVAVGEVLVDVNHLAGTTLLTGIQRVTQETVSRWHRDHEISLVRWSEDFGALERIGSGATRRLVSGTAARASDEAEHTVVVPWHSTYLLPEVALEDARTPRLQALAQYGRCATAAIGFDTVPLTSGETTDTTVPGKFMRELAALRHFDRIVTISEAAATEYRGWRTMTSSLGVAGPHIEPVALPVEARTPSAEELRATAQRYLTRGVPLVLCVGSHEPRKNHLAVLHAAELLWRRGLEFTLLFVGGNAWHSDRFLQRLGELKAAGRPVESELKAADATLWALYRLARLTVFPSLNEGFGLPVAESLASGTPAITAAYGSMREIGAAGGALLVDPRDDHAISDAMALLLTDDALHARLVDECRARPVRTWEDYAAEAWTALMRRPST